MKRLLFIGIFFSLAFNCIAAEVRILSEDCEYTDYTYHFLERKWGPSAGDNEDELIAEVARISNSCHSGTYCAQIDTYTNGGNAHAAVGYDGGETQKLNTDDFFLSDYTARYWFFRYWFRSTSATRASYVGSGTQKLLYINYSFTNDPVITHQLMPEIQGTGTTLYTSFHQGGNYDHITIGQGGDNTGYRTIEDDLFDNSWHCIEVYIDFGSTGNDGRMTLWIDNVEIEDWTNLSTYAGTTESNPIEFIQGWPGNNNYTPSGASTFDFDDFEIFADIASGGEATTGSMAAGTIEVSGGEEEVIPTSRGACGQFTRH